jgi:hypothetical protein
MNATIRALARRPGARAATATIAAALCGGTLLLAGCSAGAGTSSSGHGPAAVNGSAGSGSLSAPAAPERMAGQPALRAGRPAGDGEPEHCLYRRADRAGARCQQRGLAGYPALVAYAGGYVAGEQSSINPADRATSTVSLRLKIPVPACRPLRQLSGLLGQFLDVPAGAGRHRAGRGRDHG